MVVLRGFNEVIDQPCQLRKGTAFDRQGSKAASGRIPFQLLRWSLRLSVASAMGCWAKLADSRQKSKEFQAFNKTVGPKMLRCFGGRLPLLVFLVGISRADFTKTLFMAQLRRGRPLSPPRILSAWLRAVRKAQIWLPTCDAAQPLRCRNSRFF